MTELEAILTILRFMAMWVIYMALFVHVVELL